MKSGEFGGEICVWKHKVDETGAGDVDFGADELGELAGDGL